MRIALRDRRPSDLGRVSAVTGWRFIRGLARGRKDRGYDLPEVFAGAGTVTAVEMTVLDDGSDVAAWNQVKFLFHLALAPALDLARNSIYGE